MRGDVCACTTVYGNELLSLPLPLPPVRSAKMIFKYYCKIQ